MRRPVLARSEACTGCAACKAVCLKAAIAMVPDYFGFLRPKVVADKCVGCGACEKVCPVLHPFERDSNPICYAARTTDEELLKQSTSGGIFTELARPVIESGGCVFGCVFDAATKTAYHVKTETMAGLAAMRGSKYVQSDLRETLHDVREELSKGRQVLFTGTPCQVAAVRRYVGQHPDLLLVDLFCHGVPSPALLRACLKKMEQKLGGRITEVSFRKKEPSWRESNLVVVSSEGRSVSCPHLSDPYMRLFVGHLIKSPGSIVNRSSCFRCVHKAGASGADISIADFWGAELVGRLHDDDKGLSAVVIHTEQGRKAFQTMTTVQSEAVSATEAFQCNPSYANPDTEIAFRRLFCCVAKTCSASAAVQSYLLWRSIQPRALARIVVPARIRFAVLQIVRRVFRP